MPTSSPKDLLPLLEKMGHLHQQEQAAMVLLAILYAPVSRTAFAQCFTRAGITSAGGKLISPKEVVPLLERLVSSKLAQKNRRCKNRWPMD